MFLTSLSSRCRSLPSQSLYIAKCPADQRKINTQINEYVGKILGEKFLNSEDADKIKTLDGLAWANYYTPCKIPQSETAEAERNYQVLLAHKKIPPNTTEAMPGVFIRKDANRTSAYWSLHIVRPPYVKGTAESKHSDKDVSLGMLCKLIDSQKIPLAGKITLIAEGCDNNEAAAKFLTYLHLTFQKEVNMVCTDVSFNALTRTRGLDALIQKGVLECLKKEIPSSDIIIRDSFNEEDRLRIENNVGQKIAMPFRLTAIAPLNKILKYINRQIQENDVCLMHFFQDSPTTSEVLKNNYNYSKKSYEIKDGVNISYWRGNGLTMSVWKQDDLEAFINKEGGQILDMQEVITDSDLGEKLNMWTCVVQKKR